MNRSRLRWVGGTVSALAVIVPAGIAWACVAFMSLTTVSNTVQPGGTVTVVGREFAQGAAGGDPPGLADRAAADHGAVAPQIAAAFGGLVLAGIVLLVIMQVRRRDDPTPASPKSREPVSAR